MKCLIDGDILRYEIGFAAETSWRHKNEGRQVEWFENNPPPWDMVEEVLVQRIIHIEDTCKADEPSEIFFTGVGNFRNAIAKRKPYKLRVARKPYHFRNIEAFLKGRYDWHQHDGLEADDLMALVQTASEDGTIICTRDKDLRSVDGLHFGWEIGNQPQFGPLRVSGYGHISLSADRKKIEGYGLKFFLVQCLTGDVVDSVPGLAGCGPVAAFDVLAHTETYVEGLQAVMEAYKASYPDAWLAELTEQGCLLWMTRHLNEDGSPKLWSPFEDYQKC